jgi:hypothetical protein
MSRTGVRALLQELQRVSWIARHIFAMALKNLSSLQFQQRLDACEASGEIRAGANSEDFLVLVGLLWRIPPNAAGEARVKRLLALAFRGLGAKDR